MNERLLQLFDSFRSGNEEEMMAASNELLAFYSTPDSLPILTSFYLFTTDDFLKKSIIIGIDKALNDENFSNITSEQLVILQDNLIEMLTHESDPFLLSDIGIFIHTMLTKFKNTWPSLDNYIYSCDNYDKDYFYVLTNYMVETKTEEDCNEFIEFAYPKLQFVFQNDTSLTTQLSVFCFITTASIKLNQRYLLWEFAEPFKNFFQKVCINADHQLLESFFKILNYIEYGIESSEFSKQVCPLSDILEYSLSAESDYSNCINLRLFINETLIISETDLNDLPPLLDSLIELSKKFYSTEIDVQTQQIDDYFPILKYIPFEQRKEICFSHIENLIQENNPASTCTALAIFRGAVISGIRFNPSCLDFFNQCYDIDHFGVKMFALSIFVDISEEISTEIEENMDSLLLMFCHNLILSSELPAETREQFVLSVLDVLQTTLLFCVNFSDEVIENLLKSLIAYIQNGTQTEQFYALTDLGQIIKRSSKVALNPEIFNLLLQLLQIRDSSLKLFLYEIFTYYIDFYPMNTNFEAIVEAISNESDEDCFVYMTAISHLALRQPDNEQIKEFLMSKIDLISNECMKEDGIYNSTNDHRGSAISSLLFIMTAYHEIIPSHFTLVINSIANIVSTDGETDSNINNISKGIEAFMGIDQIENFFSDEIFNPIFEQILIKSGGQSKYINIDTNIFEVLFLMTNFVKCSQIPHIDTLTYKSLKKFGILMQSDEKKDLKEIQTISNFVRCVFNNYESQNMKVLAKQLVYLIYNQLLNKQTSPALESHLILILSSLVSNYIDSFADYKSELMPFLIEEMTNSIPNTAKSIANFFKNLAEQDVLMDFVENNQENFKLLWNSLTCRLSQDCETTTLLNLNDNIISALILIEKNMEILQIDDFYELISPYLPSYTDTDELSDIYSSLLEFYTKMNEQNQNNLIDVLIKFFSFQQSVSFICNLSDPDEEELMVFVFRLINGKIEATDDAESFINSLVKDSYHKSVFSSNFNYIGCTVQKILSSNDENESNE